MINILKALVKKSLFYLGISKNTIVSLSVKLIDICEHSYQGELTSKIILYLNKIINKNSIRLSIKTLKYINNRLIKNMEVILPGYINFKISYKGNIHIISCFSNITKKEILNVRKKDSPILIEILSANPTGPLHVGHIRSAVISDSISRLYEYMGYKIHKEYYVNNVGNQILLLGKSLNNEYFKLKYKVNYIKYYKKYYTNHYIQKIAIYLYEIMSKKHKYVYIGHWLIKCIIKSANNNLKYILKTLISANIIIEYIFEENLLYQNYNVRLIIDKYINRNILYFKNKISQTHSQYFRKTSNAYLYMYMQKGGWFLKTSLYGDKSDCIVLRYNNSPVYLLADIAYHNNKINRGYKKIINILGSDHFTYISKLHFCLKTLNLFPQRIIDNIIVQMVLFVDGKKQAKFSKRNHNIYLFDKLIKQIGNSYIRYLFLSRSPNSHLNLNIHEIIKHKDSASFIIIQNTLANISKSIYKVDLLFYSNFTKMYLKRNINKFKLVCKYINLRVFKYIILFPYIIEHAYIKNKSHILLIHLNKLINSIYIYLKKYEDINNMISGMNIRTVVKTYVIILTRRIIINGVYLLGIIFK